MPFQLHHQLQKDCIDLGYFGLCRLLLMNDSQFPWYILVPQIDNIREIYQLAPEQRHRLQEESCYLAEKLALHYRADKMNIAAIGNLVPQLHIHHIVRYLDDKAWPAPVWGKFSAIPYNDCQLETTISSINALLTALKSD
jgi:diadenosine tetraphosphate (Ap4A) HIT family hydrolase